MYGVLFFCFFEQLPRRKVLPEPVTSFSKVLVNLIVLQLNIASKVTEGREPYLVVVLTTFNSLNPKMKI